MLSRPHPKNHHGVRAGGLQIKTFMLSEELQWEENERCNSHCTKLNLLVSPDLCLSIDERSNKSQGGDSISLSDDVYLATPNWRFQNPWR